MADEDDEEPAIALGKGAPVEGAPVARVAERLMWGIEKSAIESREGDAVIRTPDGPRELESVLAEVDRTYFATRQEFLTAVEGVVGRGPVPTAADSEEEETESGDKDAEESSEGEEEADEEEADEEEAGEEDDSGEDANGDEEAETADGGEEETDEDEAGDE